MNKYVKGDVIRVERDRYEWPEATGNHLLRYVGRHGVIEGRCDAPYEDNVSVTFTTSPEFTRTRSFHERDLNWGSPRKT